MIVLFLILLIFNTLAEILFYRKLKTLDTTDRINGRYRAVCSGIRILWILLGTWLAVPLPLFLLGMLLLLYAYIRTYHDHRLTLSIFSLVMYLLYTALLMIVISAAGLFGMDMDSLQSDHIARVVLVDIASVIYSLLGYMLLFRYPRFFWRKDYDRFKVAIYSWFLLFCAIYQMFDAVLIILYETERINHILILSGNVLIAILIFNLLNYNYAFAKSEEARWEYEQSEILLAQQYFEKEELRKLSSLDSLTKLYNRREISALMQQSIQEGRGLVCVFVDLDGLKAINDTYGHACGDYTLKQFADAGTEALQQDGYLARIGGDEFLLVFLDKEAADVDKRMKALQEKLLEPKEEKNRVSFSYGIAQGQDSVENYILQADRQMYLDKNRKRRGGK